MHKMTIASLALMIGLTFSGIAFAQADKDAMCGMSKDHGMKCENMNMENCIGQIAGATYKAQNTKDGVVLTITSNDPATVKKVQADAQKLAAAKDTSANPDETVICPVYGTKMQKSKAYDSAVYKGKTYYFCCAACKPEFLKNPEKYAK